MWIMALVIGGLYSCALLAGALIFSEMWAESRERIRAAKEREGRNGREGEA